MEGALRNRAAAVGTPLERRRQIEGPTAGLAHSGGDHSRRGVVGRPKWTFDDATFDRSAAALDNPDHVAIVVHNYRWRLGLASGEPRYDDIERRLAPAPIITLP